MKSFIAILIVFALVMGFTISAHYYIVKTTDKLTLQTDKLEKNLRAKEWPVANNNFNKLKNSWEKTSNKWTVLIDHMELDKINLAIVRLNAFMETRKFPEAMAELSELKLLLEHIPESEAVNLKNIL